LAIRGKRCKAKAPRKYEPPYKSQLEQDYAAILEGRKLAGEIRDWKYEALTINLVQPTHGKKIKVRKTTLTPDWLILEDDCTITIAETKGRWRDASIVKWKLARALLPWFNWVLVTRINGAWREEEV
jgi:hypothetical protein